MEVLSVKLVSLHFSHTFTAYVRVFSFIAFSSPIGVCNLTTIYLSDYCADTLEELYAVCKLEKDLWVIPNDPALSLSKLARWAQARHGVKVQLPKHRKPAKESSLSFAAQLLPLFQTYPKGVKYLNSIATPSPTPTESAKVEPEVTPMTKKSASFPKLSDYLADNDNLNIRATVKAVREAFQEDRLDVVQSGEAFKVDAGKGIAKAKPGDNAIIYDFIIFDTDEFEAWLEENKHRLEKQSSNGSPAKLSEAQLIKLRTENPAAFEEYREKQRKATKVYQGANNSRSSNQFGEAATLIAEGKFAEAEIALNGIRTRKGSTNAAMKLEYARQIEEGRRRQAEDSE